MSTTPTKSPTPWTDKQEALWKNYKWVPTDYTRRLEALVHEMAGALSRAPLTLNTTANDMRKEALTHYNELKAEMEGDKPCA